ncbi:MAG: acyl-CoA dehydrogenase family protein [Planctomycetota bacterium]|nr:acyl-CoA dehydrogenase family protein [Planctomycetota bacterium]
MNFELSEEHQLVRESAREFAEREVAPTAAERDRAGTFPEEEFKKAAEQGFTAMLIPEAYGGAEMGTLAAVVMVEEVSRICASTGVTLSVHNSLVCSPIVRHGTEEQKTWVLPQLASGAWLGAYALSEAGAGSDAAALICRADREGDDFLLNGTKLWITSGDHADLMIIFARADEGVTAFLVETASEGFSVGKKEEKLGIRSSSTVEVILENVRVSADRVLGEVGKGLTVAFDTLDGGRIGIAGQALGISQAAFEASVRYAREREQFGRPIGDFQAISWKLAEMSANLEAARLVTYRAASLRDERRPHTRQAAEAKLVASTLSNKIVDEAVQIHGGAGYTTEFPVERYFRDARITEIYEGTTEIQRLVIARDIFNS